jgi:hypothetical protein
MTSTQIFGCTDLAQLICSFTDDKTILRSIKIINPKVRLTLNEFNTKFAKNKNYRDYNYHKFTIVNPTDYKYLDELKKIKILNINCDSLSQTVVIPSSVTLLNFGGTFNQSIDKFTLPVMLKNLMFGDFFNQSLDNIKFPQFIKILMIDKNFNQSIDNVKFPSSLKQLIISGYFNQPLDNVKFPSSLKYIKLYGNFNQPLDNVDFPDSLTVLEVGEEFKQSIDNINFPSSFLCLTVRPLLTESKKTYYMRDLIKN